MKKCEVELHCQPKVIHVKQLAEILSISLNSAYEIVRSNQIRCIKIGRNYRIPMEAVEEYLAKAS